MSARARRLAATATVSAEDVVAFNQFAAELDREADRLEAQPGSRLGMALPAASITHEQQQAQQQQQATDNAPSEDRKSI